MYGMHHPGWGRKGPKAVETGPIWPTTLADNALVISRRTQVEHGSSPPPKFGGIGRPGPNLVITLHMLNPCSPSAGSDIFVSKSKILFDAKMSLPAQIWARIGDRAYLHTRSDLMTLPIRLVSTCSGVLFDRIWPSLDQCWHGLGQVWFGFDQICVGSTESGRSPNPDALRPNVVPTKYEPCGRKWWFRPSLGAVCEIRAVSCLGRLGPRAEIGPFRSTSAEPPPKLVEVAQRRSKSPPQWSNSPRIDRTRPALAEFAPNRPASPKSGELAAKVALEASNVTQVFGGRHGGGLAPDRPCCRRIGSSIGLWRKEGGLVTNPPLATLLVAPLFAT